MALSPEISLKISADVASLNTALNSMAKNLDTWSKNAMGGVTSVAQSFVTLGARIAVATAPLTALAAGLAAITMKTANAGDELLKMGQKIGVPTEKLSALKYAAELSDVSMDELGTSLGHLSKSVVDASAGTGEAGDTFKALGINVKDANGKIKSTESLLLELADKFANMEDSMGKTAIAMALFGRSGKEMIPFLNQGSYAIKETTDKAKEMGVVFSEEAAKAAERFNDNITQLKANLTGLGIKIGNELISPINQLMETFGLSTPAIEERIKRYKSLLQDVRIEMLKLTLSENPSQQRLGVLKMFEKNYEEMLKKLGADKPKTAAPEIIDTKKSEAAREKLKKEAEEKLKREESIYSSMVKWEANMKEGIEERAKRESEINKMNLEEKAAYYESMQQWEANMKEGIEERKRMESEINRIKAETPKSDSFLQKLQKGVDSFAKALTGSTSSTEGLGAMVNAIVGLIRVITNLPGLLNILLKEIFTNLRNFPREIVNLIKDVLVNLPNILLELIITVFTELIPVLVSEIPNMIIKMISGLFEAIKTLIFGGEIKSTIDGWTQDASNQSVTVNLDTSNAMSALKQAQEALLGAVNETDRKVAREALLSARSAAILAEKQKQQTGSQTPEVKRFEGLFGMIGNIFNNFWKALEDIFGNAWVGLGVVLTAAVVLWKASAYIWTGIYWAAGKAWTILHWVAGKAWTILHWVAGGVWTVLHWAAGAVWSGIMWGVHGAVWLAGYIAAGAAWLIGLAVALGPIALIGLAIAAAFAIFNADFQKILSNAWEGLKGIFQSFLDALKSILPKQMGGSGGAMGGMVTGAVIGAVVGGPVGAVVGGAIGGIGGSLGLWHEGGLIKAHSGMYLKDDEVPIIAQFGEGILNKYKGMTAIGGEAGLNFANKYGSLPGTGKTEIHNNQTYHQHFEVVVDKDGNVMKLTRTQAKNLARTLDPVFKEMKRNRDSRIDIDFIKSRKPPFK